MPTAEGIAVGNTVNTTAPASVISPWTTNTARSVLMSSLPVMPTHISSVIEMTARKSGV